MRFRLRDECLVRITSGFRVLRLCFYGLDATILRHSYQAPSFSYHLGFVHHQSISAERYVKKASACGQIRFDRDETLLQQSHVLQEWSPVLHQIRKEAQSRVVASSINKFTIDSRQSNDYLAWT